MATWAEILADVVSWTNRPELVAETNLAIRNAVRTAHKSGKYWRDLRTTTVTPTTSGNNQEVILSDVAPRFRQVAYIKYTDLDVYLKSVTIEDLVDADGYARSDVYWGLGTKLLIRPGSTQTSYELCYYVYPVVSPTTSLDSWIAEEHNDLLVLWAASTVLGLVGEQEIKSRVDALAAIAFADLQQDNIEIQGR